MLTVTYIPGVDIYCITAVVLFNKISLLGIIHKAFYMQPYFLFSFICDRSSTLSFCAGI